MKIRNKSNKRGVRLQNAGMHSQDRQLHEFEPIDPNLNITEIVPPINDPNSEVFSPHENILAKSRKYKKTKKRRIVTTQYAGGKNVEGLWGAFPGRRLGYKKGAFSRGRSMSSGRKSSRSKKKFRNSSRSSRSSKSSARRKGRKGQSRKMKTKYIKNVLPHMTNVEEKKMVMEKFTNPGQL